MSILDKVKQMLAGTELPPETRRDFERAVSYRDLLEALDRVCTANEVKLRELEREISQLESVERSEVERLTEGEITARQKKLILQRIQRLRRQIETFDDKIDIHTKNIELHQNLMGKIQRIESMSLQAVDDDLISEVVTDFEEQFDKYKNVLHSGEAASKTRTSPLSNKDLVELRELEEELLGKPEKPEAEAVTDAPAADADTEGETASSETEDAAGSAGAEKAGGGDAPASRPARRDADSPRREREAELEFE